MSATSARFFAFVQGAGFYRRLFEEALDCLPAATPGVLLDVGCGPGLLARLAAARGHDAIGVDADPAMIATATRIARRHHSPASFVHLTLAQIGASLPQADVVAAASLLAVVPDPGIALDALWGSVKPGGTLLVVEPTDLMTPAAAKAVIAEDLRGPRRHLLRVWAAARQGTAVDPRLYDGIASVAVRQTVPLLEGLVAASLFTKSDS